MNATMTLSTTPVAAVCLAASRVAAVTSATTWYEADIRITRVDHAKARGPGGTS